MQQRWCICKPTHVPESCYSWSLPDFLGLLTTSFSCRHGGTVRCLKALLRQKLVHHDSSKYDGYRLTPLGYDFLALKALVNRGAVAAVGRQIGVGKESDVYEVRFLRAPPLLRSNMQAKSVDSPWLGSKVLREHASGTGACQYSRRTARLVIEGNSGVQQLTFLVILAGVVKWQAGMLLQPEP